MNQARQQLYKSVVTKDAAGRFRFQAGVAMAQGGLEDGRALLTKDSEGRWRFQSDAPKESQALLTKDSAGRFRFQTEIAPITPEPPNMDTPKVPAETKVDGQNVAMTFLGPALSFIAVLALVGNLVSGPSKEELARRKAEEDAAATRTTAFTLAGGAGIAYILSRPRAKGKDGKFVRPNETQRQRAREWKLERTNTEQGMGIMWSGDF
eukprot:CAMPEP_0197667128 /NCGR_PEP_ID=MMETSP1338-20131121/65221_1 /TAXON_ID=43686 ORGANISM="Pelagodinium beii, Strain RCC1491" /NCGR_SAMPLE_ID=MMETSP1338 /ASSEMBLY_ACC=CAM_ASM_000754 /LENGTH=207 /DNA_ID=CAMNT_0043246305 /DNA_START=103 /DNA_END=726 /DNA_ORIENTATION=+